MPEYERLIVQFVFSLVPVVTLYFSMKDRNTKQENRITAMEKDIENLQEFKVSANKRLDNHDEQNKAILVLAEQVKSLGEDVRELKNLIQIYHFLIYLPFHIPYFLLQSFFLLKALLLLNIYHLFHLKLFLYILLFS